MKLLLSVILSTACGLISPLNASTNSNTLFIYTDEFGHQVYSDKPPESGPFTEKTLKQTETLVWVNSTINFKSAVKKTKGRKTTANKRVAEDHCLKVKTKIQTTEKALNTRQKPELFDKLKSALSDLRWQYRKKCN